jgi:predicted NBD/HSP70 family sugar kinase
LSSTRLIRSFNAIAVLQTLYQEGSVSRSRLTEVTKMSPSTVTRIIAELTEQGLITEECIGESNGGRRPVIFRLNYNNLFAAGVQILRDRVAIAISDVKGNLLARQVFQQYSLEPVTLVQEIAVEFQKLLASSAIDKEKILGVGVAISGIVDSESETLIQSVNLGWRDVKVAELLEKALGLQVLIENDANAAALAEFWFGGAKDVSSMMYVKTSTGVGAGIISERRLLTGAGGMAGEIGHVPLVPGGRQCRCGQSGCLETYLYLADVLRRYEQETGQAIAGKEEFFQKAAAGDAVARMLIHEAADALATTVSFAEVLLDLEMIVVGGLWGSLGEVFLGRIEQKLQGFLERTGLTKKVIFRGSALGEDSDLLGAVGLVINEWFTPPI